MLTAFALTDGSEKPEAIATIAKDISSLKAAQEQMKQRNRQLAWMANKLTLAEQRERRRLAKLLHDHLQQLLAGAKLKLEIHSEVCPAEDNSDLESAKDLILQSLAASRSLVSELSPQVLFKNGLVNALEWLARRVKETYDLDVSLDLEGENEQIKLELRVLLFETIRELLFNVVKHADTRNARIEMTRNDDRVRITVSDDGSGFDPSGLWNRDIEEESGFGLFNIRERFKLLGGTFEIDSSPGKGTVVILCLPLQILSEEPVMPLEDMMLQASTAAECPKIPVRHPGDKIRIMLVDDHAVMRSGLSAMLARHDDLEIAGEAADGEEAVAMARQILPDVILMDMNMPKMNGVEATRIIHAEFPAIRIIGLSMFDAEDHAKSMKEAGAVDYLHKSGSSSILLEAIRKIEN